MHKKFWDVSKQEKAWNYSTKTKGCLYTKRRNIPGDGMIIDEPPEKQYTKCYETISFYPIPGPPGIYCN
jgi:hypothetical protein